MSKCAECHTYVCICTPHSLKQKADRIKLKALEEAAQVVSVILLAMLLSSCGQREQGVVRINGGGVETCHDGVSYLQFNQGASVKYNADGTIATC